MIKRSHGFSLVELLVVIATLLVLIAFLVPVFIAVEDRAALASCQSNLRQLGQAFHMYANEQRGNLPTTTSPHALTDAAREWENAIYMYCDAKSIRDRNFLEIAYCPSKGDYYRWDNFKYNSSYFSYLDVANSDTPLNVASSKPSSWVLADFCWGSPASRFMAGQYDRFALVDPDDPSTRLKTSHAEAKRNVLHLDCSVLVHNLFTNKEDEWPQ